jgi:hypothetical protein
MNARISRDAMAMERWDDQMVVNHVHTKTQHKWDKMVIVVKQCPPLPKQTLVKFVLKQLL